MKSNQIKLRQLAENENKKKNRIGVLMVFMLTAILSLAFWFKGKKADDNLVSPVWEGLTINMNFKSEEEREALQIEEENEMFKEQLHARVNELTGVYGVYVKALDKNYEYGTNEDELMPAASLIKLPVMVSTIQTIENGDLSYESIYTLETRDVRTGSGSLGTNNVGTQFSIEKLLLEMGKKSDNTAYAAMLRKLGQSNVQQKIFDWGLVNTTIEENLTTPREIGLLWQKIYTGEIVADESREKLWEFLSESIYEDRITLGLPEDTVLVHKVGTDVGVWSDSGIVLGNRPLVVVIMTRDASREEAQVEVAEITRMIWEFESTRGGV